MAQVTRQTVLDMPREEILYRLLKKQAGYYEAILDLAEEEFIKLNHCRSTPELLPLMKRKQVLLSCIEEIDRALVPIKKHWQAHKQEQCPGNARVQEELCRLEKLLARIIEIDTKNQALLKAHMRTN